ncbi:TetR/AcrR family transcriptional regulator [Dactylosporangium sp. NPDC000244]|uniref:TetR/AcrR family transcriptional regulator n=1 Tax=Dactylosporangium sp. NPDC000244 TaxID=3154365 RepID=UPI00331D3295
MAEVMGLRERKKQRTREAISRAAITLFLQNGYDQVSVAQVAQAAEVSKMTVFHYFPAKEDLVLYQSRDHFEETAKIVRTRPPGQSPLGALRAHFLAGLAERDASTGLCNDEDYLVFQRMIHSTQNLRLGMTVQLWRSEESLASAIAEAIGADPGGIVPRVAARQVLVVQQTLVGDNLRRILAGENPDDIYESATAAARTAFDLLEKGLSICGLATG